MISLLRSGPLPQSYIVIEAKWHSVAVRGGDERTRSQIRVGKDPRRHHQQSDSTTDNDFVSDRGAPAALVEFPVRLISACQRIDDGSSGSSLPAAPAASGVFLGFS